MDHEDVMKAYEELSLLSQYEDAGIIHAMYRLSLDPYALYLFTFEGIICNNVIEYWNHKTESLKCKVICKDLMNDFKYLKGILERTGEKSTNTTRTAYDGKTVTGTFIFSKSPTNI